MHGICTGRVSGVNLLLRPKSLEKFLKESVIMAAEKYIKRKESGS